MQTLLRLSLTFAFLLLNACAFSKDDGNKVPAEQSASDIADEINRKSKERLQEEVMTAEDFEFEVVAHKLANRYFVKINYIPKSGVKIFISKDGRQILNVAPGMTIDALGGEVMNFNIVVYNGSADLVLNTLTSVQIPTDFVVSEDHELTKDTNMKLGRLFFRDKATLKTNGYLLSIEADHIIAGAQSQIINFSPEDYLSSVDKISGGTISLRAKKSSGYLIVKLQGAQGNNSPAGLLKRATNGPRQTSHLNGRNGQDAVVQTEQDCPANDGSFGLEVCRTSFFCAAQPGNGENGLQGPEGEDGDDGQIGGNSGNLFVQIEDESEFTLKLSLAPGRGGLPGDGAPGYPGGQPGKAGQGHSSCKAAADGAAGAAGSPGKNGKPGSTGKLGTYELNGLKNVIIEIERVP